MSIETRLHEHINKDNLDIGNRDVPSLVEFIREEILKDRDNYLKVPR